MLERFHDAILALAEHDETQRRRPRAGGARRGGAGAPPAGRRTSEASFA